MKATFDILKQYDLYDSLPEAFKQCPAGQKYLFKYYVDEDNLKLKIVEETTVANINVSLYRGLQELSSKTGRSLSLGYFNELTLDTRDGIFYLFLKTFNTAEKVNAFYSHCVRTDRKADISVSSGAITNIYNETDFRNTIAYFCPSGVTDIMTAYDLVAAALKRVSGLNLFGQIIKRVVTLVKFTGGAMPDIGGTMRYMIIGENAVLSETEKADLNKAKSLLRSENDPKDIYIETGWFFLENDGKWRRNISDNEARIDTTSLTPDGDYNILVPKDFSTEDVKQLFVNPQNLYAANYTGRLFHVLNHSLLFEKYPRLKGLPLLYWIKPDYTAPQRGHQYYFNPNKNGGFIVMYGSYEWGTDISILLHEIQHAIQRIEGFSQGGNQTLARFVASVGGQSIRKVFTGINSVKSILQPKMKTGVYNILKPLIDGQVPTNETSDYLTLLKELFDTYEIYEESGDEIIYYLMMYAGIVANDFNNPITDALSEPELVGEHLYTVTNLITEALYAVSNVRREYMDKGLREKDIDRILFETYQNLYGETESRSVQASRLVCSEFRNYFYLTEWESRPLSEIVVIDNMDKIVNEGQIKGACEEKGGDYVMHFKRGGECTPFVHELGHIVYDFMTKNGYEDRIKERFAEIHTFHDIEEYFVNRFVGYMADLMQNTKFHQEVIMKPSYGVSEAGMNAIFDSFFIVPMDETMYSKHFSFLSYLLQE